MIWESNENAWVLNCVVMIRIDSFDAYASGKTLWVIESATLYLGKKA